MFRQTLITTVLVLTLCLAHAGAQSDFHRLHTAYVSPHMTTLGVTVAPAPAALAAQFGLEQGQGLVIVNVAPDSPAAKADLQRHDLLHKLDETPITSPGELRQLLQQYAGREVTLHIIRKAQPLALRINLPAAAPEPDARGLIRATFLGVATEALTPPLAEQLNIDFVPGVLTIAVIDGSPAAKAGVKRHDIIQKIDDQPIAHPDELRQIIRAAHPGHKAALHILRDGRPITLQAQLVEEKVLENPTGLITPDRLQWMKPDRFDIPPTDGALDEDIQALFEQLGPQMEQMRQQMRRLMEDRPLPMPEFPRLDLKLEMPRLAPGEGGVSVSTYTDMDHTITITRDAKGARAEVRNRDGEVIFEGPWQTEEDKAQAPEELRRKIDAVDRPLHDRMRPRPWPQRRNNPDDLMV